MPTATCDPDTTRAKSAVNQPVDLNLPSLLDRVGGDSSLLREIAAIFLDEVPGLLAEMEAAADAGDALRLQHAAHAVKGSVANFEVAPVTQAALTLELMGTTGDLSDVEEA